MVKNPPANAGDSGWIPEKGMATHSSVLAWRNSWLRGKESTYQCRRHRRCGFNPWVGKIPNPLKYSCLENPMVRGAVHGRLQPMGSQKVRHD